MHELSGLRVMRDDNDQKHVNDSLRTKKTQNPKNSKFLKAYHFFRRSEGCGWSDNTIKTASTTSLSQTSVND